MAEGATMKAGPAQKSGYLARLIARAVPPTPHVPARHRGPSNLIDPFEAAETIAPTAAVLAPSLATPAMITPPVTHGEVSAPAATAPAVMLPDASPSFERTVLEQRAPASTAEHAEDEKGIELPAPTAPLPLLQMQPPPERVGVRHEGELIPMPKVETPVSAAQVEPVRETIQEKLVESRTHSERVEKVIAREPPPPIPILVPEALPAPPAAMMHPQPAQTVAPLESPTEPEGLVIGRLIVDVVPTPPPTPVAPNRQRVRAPSPFQPSSDRFFGLGQL